jgi:hypothetical protein
VSLKREKRQKAKKFKLELSRSRQSQTKTYFENELKKLLPHQFRIIHQFKTIRMLKNNLTSEECVLQIDFSENYSCKANEEIQSMHFGASRSQISLHTCHATFSDLSTKCYCTLSEDTRHSPPAIWAHLKPVIDDLVTKGISILHFVSDGPTTQYRNKTNFALMAIKPFSWGMKYLTWNLLEASHGKGPADGVGAVVKSAADRLVAHGKDILNLQDLNDGLEDNLKGVQLYTVHKKDIDDVADTISTLECMPVKGTMKIHQLIAPSVGVFHHRPLSCYCKGTMSLCPCHHLEKIILPKCDKKTSKKLGKKTALESVEEKLTEEQRQKFKRRFEEGYDLQIEDLKAEQKTEYALWRTWNSLKQKAVAEDQDLRNEQCDSSTSDDSEMSEWAPDEVTPSGGAEVKCNSFYAVFFSESQATNILHWSMHCCKPGFW